MMAVNTPDRKPWIPAPLWRVYRRAYIESGGDAAAAVRAMREAPEYDTFFGGNRITEGPLAGSFRLSERDYASVVEGYRQNLAARGINPAVFEGRWGRWIGNNISVQEFDERIDEWDDFLRSWGPQGTDGYSEAINYYARRWGTGEAVTPEAVLASVLDPEVGQDIAKRRIRMAQVGGAAASFGYNRSVKRVGELMGYGLTGDQAIEFYSEASRMQPTADTLARRFNDPAGGVGIGDLEDAFIRRDTAQADRLERNRQREQASFSRTGVAQGREGQVSGLRPT